MKLHRLRPVALALGCLLSSITLSCGKTAGDGERGQRPQSPSPKLAPSTGSTSVTSASGASVPQLLEGYAIATPHARLTLPKELVEISGLTDVSNTEVACVQDELGVIFVLELETGRILRQIPFGDPGDYEGLTRVGEVYYVLRSDGVLFEVSATHSDQPKVFSIELGLRTADNEGLCADPFAPRLLVSSKSRPGKSEAMRRMQALFEFDLASRSLAEQPAVRLELDDVFDGHPKTREKRGGRLRVVPSRFLPSSVAVHPQTGRIFMLSAVAGNLAVFDRTGKLLGQHPLERSLFPQPEGLTFLPNGELVISNEGGSGRATLLRFRAKG